MLFLWLFARLDRYSSIPAKAKVVAFLFSGLVSTFAMAAINNDAFRSILAKTVSLEFMQIWSAGVDGPVVGGDRQDAPGRVADRARSAG